VREAKQAETAAPARAAPVSMRRKAEGRAGAATQGLRLQRLVGNRVAGRLLQPKLTVSAPNDRYEQEADRVADHVMGAASSPAAAATESSPAHLQRCACGGTCAACAGEDEATHLQPLRISAAPSGLTQNKATDTRGSAEEQDGSTEVDETLEGRIEALRGGGQPLPPGVRTLFEPRFGRDFSDVRVHTGASAAPLTRALNARAFTVGHDVIVSPGEYAPATPSGQHLLAHELTHVVQQTGGHRDHGGSDHLAAGGGAPAVSRVSRAPSLAGDMTAQREGFSALDIAQSVIDPKALVGIAWLKLSRPMKLRFIDAAIDAAVATIDVFPGQIQFGAFWEFIKEGLKGFYAKLKSSAEDVKVLAMDKIATIVAGRDEAFALAYLKGLAKGFFIDGALGIFIAIYDLIKVLGKLWDFLKGIGEAIGRFPEDMERLLQGFADAAQDLAANFGTALDDLTKFLTDPTQTRSFIATIVEKGKTMAKEAGESIASSLLTFFSKPEASAEIGETAGNIAGQVLWEVLFAVLTAGGGAAATAAKGALKSVTTTIGKLLGKVVSGVLKVVREIRAVFVKAVEWVKAAVKFIKGKLSELCGKFAKLLEDVGEFFAKLLRDCHESKLFCDFEQIIAKLLKINKAKAGALKELAGKLHGLRRLEGQAIAVVEVRVGGTVRYAAATNAGAGWAPAQAAALEKLGIEKITPIGKELVHAEPHVDAWIKGLRKGGEKVEVLRWGISAGREGAYICYPCRTIIKSLGGAIEEFALLGKTY
jgi:hypothetical protein